MRLRRLAGLAVLVVMAGTVAPALGFEDDGTPHGRRGRTFRSDHRPGRDWHQRDDRQGDVQVLPQDTTPHTYWGTTRPYWGTMQPYWGSNAPRGTVTRGGVTPGR